jgi:prepilin-type processing-associated H-X9-DG protein
MDGIGSAMQNGARSSAIKAGKVVCTWLSGCCARQAILWVCWGSSYWYDGPNALKVWSLEDYKNPAQNVIMTDYYPGHLGDDPDGKALNLLYADFHVKNATWNQRNDILTAQGD